MRKILGKNLSESAGERTRRKSPRANDFELATITRQSPKGLPALVRASERGRGGRYPERSEGRGRRYPSERAKDKRSRYSKANLGQAPMRATQMKEHHLDQMNFDPISARANARADMTPQKSGALRETRNLPQNFKRQRRKKNKN